MQSRPRSHNHFQKRCVSIKWRNDANEASLHVHRFTEDERRCPKSWNFQGKLHFPSVRAGLEIIKKYLLFNIFVKNSKYKFTKSYAEKCYAPWSTTETGSLAIWIKIRQYHANWNQQMTVFIIRFSVPCRNCSYHCEHGRKINFHFLPFPIMKSLFLFNSFSRQCRI